MVKRPRSVLKVFFISGCIGVLVVIAVLVLAQVRPMDPSLYTVMLCLAPGMIVGIADPTTPIDIALTLVVEGGVNFLLYGLAGALLFSPLIRSGSAPTPASLLNSDTDKHKS